jgi:hypothetical protein
MGRRAAEIFRLVEDMTRSLDALSHEHGGDVKKLRAASWAGQALSPRVRLLGVLFTLFAALGCWSPYDASLLSPTTTPCPPAPTPERSMPAEARMVLAQLEQNAISGAQVGATGIQNCPTIPTADTVAWFDIRIPVDDLNDTAYLGNVLAVVQESTSEWPEAGLHLVFWQVNDPDQSFRLRVTGQMIKNRRASGLSGAELYNSILEENTP